ncbi:hypothetical protein EDD16DRAFT_1598455 [Pisolithus croceorrhizus]|nr:hypothetical protein EV401DRAFT_2010913 [Pisolithus croceorrhizus]KAI6114614.1 hypothetical protein EDD16DRAFT_1598455 [Pisolithus croceorrhizus]KAI6146607.1 hypothetical protein EDD17DRAFT_1651030 [Pisolithus thermaeus]
MDRLLAVLVCCSNQVTRLWGGPLLYPFAMAGKTRRRTATRSKTNGGYIQAEAVLLSRFPVVTAWLKCRLSL